MTKKYERPHEPLTEEVKEKIDAKINTLIRKSKDFGNIELHEYRRNDIKSRMIAAAMTAFQKFIPNDECSYETYVESILVNVARTYLHNLGDEIEEANLTVHGDAYCFSNKEEGPSLFDVLRANKDDYLETSLSHFDRMEIAGILRTINPRYANIFILWQQGYTHEEMGRLLGISESYISNKLWPKVKALAKKIYTFEKK